MTTNDRQAPPPQEPPDAERADAPPARAPTAGRTPTRSRDRLRSRPPPAQPPTAPDGADSTERPAPPGGRVHLVLGPVGAGKSTFASRLAVDRAAPRFSLDDWMSRLFRPDRPESGIVDWYVERAGRCAEQIWRVAEQLTALGRDVVLELGLIRRVERESFYARLDAAGSALTIYLIEAERQVRRQRVLERNASRGETFSMLVPEETFELASDLWEPLDAVERLGRDVRPIRTD